MNPSKTNGLRLIQVKASRSPKRQTGTMFRHVLTREIAVIVTVKVALVIAAAVFIFGPSQRPAIDFKITQEHLLGNQATTASGAFRND